MPAPITIFSFGYDGWGPHTRELVKLVDQAEREDNFQPPLWVDVRHRRNVRAEGFQGNTFARLVGLDRYLWLQGLGNGGIDKGTGIDINYPNDAAILLWIATREAERRRRVVFFCSCPFALIDGELECHRWRVGSLLLREATRADIPITVVEWPGRTAVHITREVSPKIFQRIRRAVERNRQGFWRMPIKDLLPYIPKVLPHCSIVTVQSAGGALKLVTGPANPSNGWHLPIEASFEGARLTARERQRVKRLGKSEGYSPRLMAQED
jgi:hypothetical protein